MNRKVLRAFLNPVRRLSPREAGERILRANALLLVKPHHKMGDLLVSTPVIRNLRLALPEARLVLVAGPVNQGAVHDNPDLDRVDVVRMTGPSVLANLPQVLRWRRERFDAAILLSTIDQSSTAVALAHLARPGFVVGLDDSAWGGVSDIAYDCVVPPLPEPRFHMVDYNLALLEGLGIPVLTREHVLGVTGAQRAAGDAALREAGIDPSRPLLGIQIGSAPEAKARQWPATHYATLAQKARGELGWQVVLLGTPADEPAVEQVQLLGHKRFPVLTRLDFGVYKGVMSRLDCFVSHDGGPAHVAAGLGVTSLLLYLAAPAWRWAPYGAHVHVLEDLNHTPTAPEVWRRLLPLLEASQAVRPGASTPEPASG